MVYSIIKELEYLSDLRVITPQQFSSILAQVPKEIPSSSSSLISPLPSPVPTHRVINILKNRDVDAQPTHPHQPPLNEKQPEYFAPSPAPALPPPAYAPTYASAPAAPTLAIASALYEYKPSDAGDLALLPSDRISITEFMNADWAKGRNERTGLDGIFPRSYVTIVEEDKHASSYWGPPHLPVTSNYGNLPLDVSQSGGGSIGGASGGGKESKLDANGKKFGKKLGNASQSPKYTLAWLSKFSVLLTFFQRFLVPGLPSVRKLSMGYFRIEKVLVFVKQIN